MEKLIVAHLLNSPPFTYPEGSLPRSEQSSAGRCHQPDNLPVTYSGFGFHVRQYATGISSCIFLPSGQTCSDISFAS